MEPTTWHHRQVAGRFDLTPRTAEVLSGQPRYRFDQLWRGLHAGRDLDSMGELPAALRSLLDEALDPPLGAAAILSSDGGRTTKFAWVAGDGARFETVLMDYERRRTVCVSSQAGCAMACSFCATGQAGFTRHLTAGEIVEQVVRALHRPGSDDGAPPGRRNVTFMGMGEPMANFDAVWEAVERFHDVMGISARAITISTVGIVPGIDRLATKSLPVNLAVSLHAANDELRDRLVPPNRRYPIRRLVESAERWTAAHGRRLSFEWAMIAGVNDRPRDAGELAALAHPLGAHVNLIPLNPTPGYPVRPTSPTGVADFCRRLRQHGVNATIRHNRGTDIAAACGQLAASSRLG